MPTYDYACSTCSNRFDTLRSVAMRNVDAACHSCGGSAPRVMVFSPSLALLADTTRNAFATHERARHAPKQSGDYARLKHPSGCGCCTGSKRGSTVMASDGSKAFPAKRPWMISH